MKVERRTIEHIPHDERHGKAKDLFPVWFGANMHITTLVTGTLPVTMGLDLFWSIAAIIIGPLSAQSLWRLIPHKASARNSANDSKPRAIRRDRSDSAPLFGHVYLPGLLCEQYDSRSRYTEQLCTDSGFMVYYRLKRHLFFTHDLRS